LSFEIVGDARLSEVVDRTGGDAGTILKIDGELEALHNHRPFGRKQPEGVSVLEQYSRKVTFGFGGAAPTSAIAVSSPNDLRPIAGPAGRNAMSRKPSCRLGYVRRCGCLA
jgi:hypothetical protein